MAGFSVGVETYLCCIVSMHNKYVWIIFMALFSVTKEILALKELNVFEKKYLPDFEASPCREFHFAFVSSRLLFIQFNSKKSLES